MQIDVVIKGLATRLSVILGRTLCGLGASVVVACAHYAPSTPDVAELPPLQLAEGTLTPGAAVAEVETPCANLSIGMSATATNASG